MRAWWALALVALVGCNFESSEVQTISNACGSDASCPAGVCDGNICIDDTSTSVDVAIEVLRGSSDTLGATPASWVFAPESFSGSTEHDLALPATRGVRGMVRWDGLRVPATLRFVRRMPGAVAQLTPVPVEVETLREPAGGDGPGGFDFATALVAGETYDVVVLPSTDMVMEEGEASAPAIRSLPPLYLEVSVEGGDPSEPFRFDVVFPAGIADPCTSSTDTECTLEADVISVEDDQEVPESGLQVRAVDKTTGRVLSSIAETDENGHFAIRIGEAVSDYLIRVTFSVGRDPFPAVSVDPEVAFAGDQDEKRIYIPRLPRIQFTGQVRDTSQSPVPGATVRLLSTNIFGPDELGLEGSFSASATTSEDGSFGAELLAGLYSIIVTPPEDVENTWGVLSTEVLVGRLSATTDPLVVPSQVGLRGQVTTFFDEPATGVAVLARARLGDQLDEVHRSQEAASDSLGAFAMSVDEGQYDMHVKVPPETGFAWLVEPELVMSAEQGDLTRDYRLDPPIPIHGVVRASGGEPAADAQLRAYVLMAAEGDETRAIQVAETLSSEDGSYRLLIAPRLGDE